MKSIFSSKIMTFLLISAFLVVSTGNVFGFAWCVGDDGHVEVSYVNSGDCCAEVAANGNVTRYGLATISPSDDDHCGSCLDFSAQQSEAVFLKRLKRTAKLFSPAFSANIFSSTDFKYANQLGGNCLSQPLPRISQAILAHRTVVLRN